MALFEWRDEFATGVAVIDEDHQLLISLINQLHDVVEADQDYEVVASVLTVLTEYTHTHFAREELLLKKTDYPHLDQHMEQHRKLKKQVVDIYQKFMSDGGSTVAMETLVFLKEWLTKHILGTDLGYKSYVDGVTLTHEEEMSVRGLSQLEMSDKDPLLSLA